MAQPKVVNMVPEGASPEEKKVGVVQRVIDTAKALGGPLWWVFPIAVALVSMASAPLRRTFAEFSSLDDVPWMHLFVQIFLCIGWVVTGLYNATNTSTPVSGLKKDAAISTTIFWVLNSAVVWLLAKGQLPVGLVLPLLAAVVDVYITADRAINNAAQKPIVQQQNVGA